MVVCYSLKLPLASCSGVVDFIRRALLWCSIPIFSSLLECSDLMELQSAEFAPAALSLRWTHCSRLYKQFLHADSRAVLPPVEEEKSQLKLAVLCE